MACSWFRVRTSSKVILDEEHMLLWFVSAAVFPLGHSYMRRRGFVSYHPGARRFYIRPPNPAARERAFSLATRSTGVHFRRPMPRHRQTCGLNGTRCCCYSCSGCCCCGKRSGCCCRCCSNYRPAGHDSPVMARPTSCCPLELVSGSIHSRS